MKRLEGKIAFVSGGGRGIGAAAAMELARLGAKVAVNYVRQEEAAQAVVNRIRQAGGEAALAQADVRDPEQVHAALAPIRAAWGEIDILVSNAHMSFVMKPILAMQWEELAQKLQDEMKAAFTLTQAVLPAMIERRYGRLIYISSNASEAPVPYMAAHGSAKAALDAFVKYVAQESAPHGVTANLVSPGLVETEASSVTPEEYKRQLAAMTPLQRVGLPEDISGAIALYASEESRFMTGTRLQVNGGVRMD